MTSKIIVIEREVLKSNIYRSLSSTSKDVYNDFLMRCRIDKIKARPGRQSERIITNNGKLEYTYIEAEKKGIPRASFMRALNELVEKGFIDISHSGSGGVKGDKSLYSISDRWRTWGTDNFIKKTRPKDIRAKRGFLCGDQHWKRKKLMSENKNHKHGNVQS